MPSTLRTAVARVVGARLELRSESALLLAPGRAPQRVRSSPGQAGDAGYELRRAHFPPFASPVLAREPIGTKDEAGRQPAANLAAAKIQRFVLGKGVRAWRRCCS